MADNIYLLETRLSKAQQAALGAVRDVARSKGLTVFLVGGAVRDLIGGTAVRDLDVAVQGNASKLKKDIEKAGGVIAGERDAAQAFYVRFPGGVRMEIGSTLTVSYPKPGKPVVKPATILDDLRRRDFTANAMALSLNEGSYGLLMDPLNGVADIENRELRLVSNYGFIEDPVRMIRAARLMARLGWRLDEKTQTRYETGKAEGYISAMDEFHRGYETEEIFHEEDALRVMRRLEEEGWMQHLVPGLSAAKANVAEMERMRESQAQLQTMGVVADAAAANFPLLAAKMSAKEIEALKRSFPRQGFVREIEELEAKGKEFVAQLGGKGAALASQAYKLIRSAEPEAVLWAAHTTKNAALQSKFKSFYSDWPQARQRLPYLLMQEMRITPDLPVYEELLDKLYFELMDERLGTVEEMKAYLEPYSPPAPPPPVSLRRPRAAKKEAKPAKSRKKAMGKAEGGDGEEIAGSAVEVAGAEVGAAAEGDKAVAETAGRAGTKAAGKAAAKADASAVDGPAEAADGPAKVVQGRAGSGSGSAAGSPARAAAAEKAGSSDGPAGPGAAAKSVAGKSAAVPAKSAAPAKAGAGALDADKAGLRSAAPGKDAGAKKVASAGKVVPAGRVAGAKNGAGAKHGAAGKNGAAGKHGGGNGAGAKSGASRNGAVVSRGAPAAKRGVPVKHAKPVVSHGGKKAAATRAGRAVKAVARKGPAKGAPQRSAAKKAVPAAAKKTAGKKRR